MYRLIVYIMMKCKNKWIWNMFKWTFYFYFHLLPLDKWDWCKTGTLNVCFCAIKVIVNRRFLNILYYDVKKKVIYMNITFLQNLKWVFALLQRYQLFDLLWQIHFDSLVSKTLHNFHYFHIQSYWWHAKR